MPLISVIVPIYKVEQYIHRCINSILNQSFCDFELILVDDGSPDNCGAICDEYAHKDSRVHVIHQENNGVSVARNTALDWVFASSNSQWLTFIDSDDWVHPEYLHRLYYAVVKDKTLISMCAMENVHKLIPFISATQETELLTPDAAYSYKSRWPITYVWGRLYHKDLFLNLRFPVGKLWEDLFIYHKIIFQVDKISYNPSPMYYYFINYNGIVRSKWTPQKFDQLQAFENAIIFLRDRHALQSYPVVVRSYFSSIHLNFLEVEKSHLSKREQKTHKKFCRKKMRKAIFQYKKDLNTSFSGFIHYFEIGFPTLMKLYWYWIAIVKKIKFWK